MKSDKTFLVAGGDLRQAFVAGHLAREYTVYALGFDNDVELDDRVVPIESVCELGGPPDYIVFPIPASNDSEHVNMPLSHKHTRLQDVLEAASPDTVIFAGKAGKSLAAMCHLQGLELIDYMEREELAVLNAVPTAEGAIQIAMEEMPTTLYGQKCLITGFGRISKALIRALSGLGMEVSVSARKYGDLAWIQVYGCKAVPIRELPSVVGQYDLVLNTVPAMLFDRSVLRAMKKGSLLIDLASKPGGVDFTMAKELGVKAIWALSLPGKVAPVTAGEIICNTIRNMIQERGSE